MLTEFGGIAFSPNPDQTWGYSRSESQEAFADECMELISVVRSLQVLAGFCYTQFSDTYQEANGLLYADRTPKFPLQDIALAVQGSRTTRDVTVEWAWRERLMNHQRTRYHDPARGLPDPQVGELLHDNSARDTITGVTAGISHLIVRIRVKN